MPDYSAEFTGHSSCSEYKFVQSHFLKLFRCLLVWNSGENSWFSPDRDWVVQVFFRNTWRVKISWGGLDQKGGETGTSYSWVYTEYGLKMHWSLSNTRRGDLLFFCVCLKIEGNDSCVEMHRRLRSSRSDGRNFRGCICSLHRVKIS